MSIASDRKKMRDWLPSYALLTLKEFATLLSVSDETAKEKLLSGHVPWVNRGTNPDRPLYGVDPLLAWAEAEGYEMPEKAVVASLGIMDTTDEPRFPELDPEQILPLLDQIEEELRSG